VKSAEKTYEKLKELLDQEKFPKLYVFKFIILTDDKKEQKVRACFVEKAKITLTYSRSKKYTTLSILQTMSSSQAIIDKYLLVSKIKNVIHI